MQRMFLYFDEFFERDEYDTFVPFSNKQKNRWGCGKIGEMMNPDPTIIRLVVVVLAIVTGILPFFIGYLTAWWIVPVGKPQQTNTTT